jgi:prepilin-type N-terminal cleavage/methylation domain-containing protein/prepilin-type processing-associated H-X9-DG protein
MKTTSTRGFALIEILVCIAAIAILIAILFPVFAQVRDKARQASCLANGKQIGLSYAMYQQDYDGRLPLTNHHGGLASWIQACQPYIKNRGVYRCPADTGAKRWAATEQEWADKAVDVRRSSYFLNGWLSGSSRFGGDATVNLPANLIYVAESREDNRGDHFHPMCWGETDPEFPACARAAALWDAVNNETREIALRRHQDGGNYFYLDGHAKWGKWSQVYWQDRARGVYEGNFDPRQ